jgi:putative endonuclease
MSNSSTRARGQIAESRAEAYLIEKGLTLVDRNYQIKRGARMRSEIDLIMRDSDYWVFVEVRMRLNPNFGNSLESINRQKQRLIIHAAKHFLLERNLYDRVPCRFDAIGIDHAQEIIWIKDAFNVKYTQ